VALEPYTGDEPSNFEIPTSDGRLRPAHPRGVLRFDLGGERRQLTAYTFDGGDGESLFVPFLDATSGTETYGAGATSTSSPRRTAPTGSTSTWPTPVVRLRPEVLVPAHAGREPAAGPHRGGERLAPTG
jgi:hypothetical protein